MSPEEAEQCALNDAQGIIIDANSLALDLASGERRIIVSGSHIAPSWRALDGGSKVWGQAMCYRHGLGTEPDDDAMVALMEAYTDTLDRETDNWDAPNGACLYWDEGDLFVGIPEED